MAVAHSGGCTLFLQDWCNKTWNILARITLIYTDVSTRLRSSIQFGCAFIDLVGKGNFVYSDTHSAGIALLQSTTIHFLHIAGLLLLHCLSREDLIKWQHTQRDRKMFCYRAICLCYCLHVHLFLRTQIYVSKNLLKHSSQVITLYVCLRCSSITAAFSLTIMLAV